LIDSSSKENTTGGPNILERRGVMVRSPMVLSQKKGKGKKGTLFKKGGGGGRGSFQTVAVPCRLFPPDYNPIPTRTVWRRWLQNAAVVNQAFTLADGHNQFLVITTVVGAVGTGIPYVDCWRIKKICIWAISEGNFATSVSLTPTGADLDSNMFNDRERNFACSSRSTAEPGSVAIIPAMDQPMGGWHFTSNLNSAATLFQMTVSVNGGTSNNRCTLDIEFEYVENYTGLPLGYSKATLSTTPGTVGGENILVGFALANVNNLG